MDRLKDFVEDNRVAFDQAEPGPALWRHIEQQLDGGQPSVRIGAGRPWYHLSIAASVAVLIALGVTWTKYRKPITENRSVMQLSPRQGTELIRFAGSVDKKREELESLTSENPELKEEFEADIEMLGKQYDELKKSLPNNPNQNEILEEMKKNLQWQMELLEQQKEVIDQEKRQKEGMVEMRYQEDEPLPVRFV